MKISGSFKTEIEISKEEQKRISIDFLCQQFNWKSSFYIKDNDVYDRVLINSSHTWIDNMYMRKASYLDICINAIIEKLKTQ